MKLSDHPRTVIEGILTVALIVTTVFLAYRRYAAAFAIALTAAGIATILAVRAHKENGRL